MHLPLDNVLQFRLSFLWSFYFLFWPVLWSFLVYKSESLQRFRVNIHLYGCPVHQLQGFPNRNVCRIETWIKSWRFPLHMANHFFFALWISTKDSKTILVFLVGWFFHWLKILVTQCQLNYHINMISYNMLPLASSFYQHRSLDTFWGQLHNTLTT